MDLLLVALGGGLGSVARYKLAPWINQLVGTGFPYGTLLINVTGSFVLGFFLSAIESRVNIASGWRPFFAVGFLGGYTTFSTFEYESFRLLADGSVWPMLINFIGSGVAGLLAVWLGITLAKML